MERGEGENECCIVGGEKEECEGKGKERCGYVLRLHCWRRFGQWVVLDDELVEQSGYFCGWAPTIMRPGFDSRVELRD